MMAHNKSPLIAKVGRFESLEGSDEGSMPRGDITSAAFAIDSKAKPRMHRNSVERSSIMGSAGPPSISCNNPKQE